LPQASAAGLPTWLKRVRSVVAHMASNAEIFAKGMDASMYDKASLAQASLHKLASPALRKAAAAAVAKAVRHGDPCVSILVIGAATGVNDLAAIEADVLPEIRGSTKDLPVHILFTDLPSNEYNTLLANMSKFEVAHGNVWLTAKVGYSAQPIAPPESVHLVLCFSTLHWVQELPWGTDQSALDGAISYVQLPPTPKEALRAAADTELTGFFASRFAELRAGAQIVAVFDGETDLCTHQFAQTYHLLRRGLDELVSEGLLPADIIQRYFIPTASFSEARVRAVVESIGGEIIDANFLDIPCPYQLEWQASNDAVTHGVQVATAVVGCMKKQLEVSMVACGKSESEAGSLIEELLARLSKIAEGAPKEFHTGGITAFVHLAKTCGDGDK